MRRRGRERKDSGGKKSNIQKTLQLPHICPSPGPFRSSSALLWGPGSSYLRTSSPAFLLLAISQWEVPRRVAGTFFMCTLTSLLHSAPPPSNDDTPSTFPAPTRAPQNPLSSPCLFVPRDANSFPLMLISGYPNHLCLPPSSAHTFVIGPSRKPSSTEPS